MGLGLRGLVSPRRGVGGGGGRQWELLPIITIIIIIVIIINDNRAWCRGLGGQRAQPQLSRGKAAANARVRGCGNCVFF